MEARSMIETKVTGANHWAIQGLPRGGTATCMLHPTDYMAAGHLKA